MMISELNIKEDEFDMFITFNASEKIEFLSDALEYGVEIAMLNQVCDISEDEPPLGVITSSQDFIHANARICVTTLKGELQLNSDSLGSIRSFIRKLTNDGLVLMAMKKTKSDMDIYRYFRAFSVHGHVAPISLN